MPGFPLSPDGVLAVQRTAQFLKDKHIGAIYASPLTRAHETAEIIAESVNVPIKTDDRLMDIRTPLQGKSLDIVHKLHWNIYSPDVIRAGGETLREVFTRTDGRNVGGENGYYSCQIEIRYIPSLRDGAGCSS